MAKKNKKNKNAGELTLGIKQGSPFASAIVMNLQYFHGTLIQEPSTGVGAFNQYRLNSLYDPDMSGTGKQPLGFDQYSVLYSRYRVLKAHVEVHCANRVDSSFANYVLVVWPSAQSSITSDPESWAAQPMAQYRLGSIVAGGGAIQSVKFTVDLARLLGVNAIEYKTDADFSSITNANPLRVAYLHVGMYGIGTIAGCIITTKITYTAEWSQPVTLALS